MTGRQQRDSTAEPRTSTFPSLSFHHFLFPLLPQSISASPLSADSRAATGGLKNPRDGGGGKNKNGAAAWRPLHPANIM